MTYRRSFLSLIVALLSLSGLLRAQTWMAATTEFPTQAPLRAPSIAFGNGVFVAAGLKAPVSSGGNVTVSLYSSTDGATWTEQPLTISGLSLVGVGRVFFANGRFVVMGDGSNFTSLFGWSATSTDGANWTVATNTNGINALHVAGGNGTYVITAGTSMRVSTDHGATWKDASAPGGGTATAGWGDVAYLNGRFIMTGEGFSPRWWTSEDGITWTNTTIAGTGGARVEAGNGVVIRYVGSYQTSTDLLSFTVRTPAPLDNGVNRNLVFSGSRFLFDRLVFTGITPTVRMVTSTDGLTFTDFGNVPLSSFNLTGAAEGNGRIVIVGSNGVTRAYAYFTEAPSAPTIPVITTSPQSQAAASGGTLTLASAASGGGVSYQWMRNGAAVAGGTDASLTLLGLQPSITGIYSVVATNSAASVSSRYAIVGLNSTTKVLGSGSELQGNIAHANGNIFDQVQLSGAAATFTADGGQITRMSFVDLHNDIVQVEFSGAGSVSIVLDDPTGPAAPVNYNQPTVSYMKGHAGIVVSGANETTHLSVFSVGRTTAVNPALFRDNVTYDGMADIAFIAISSTNGKFGGLRTSNVSYFASRGLTGVYAPNVEFTGPVYVGDINASDNAMAVLVIGSSADTRVTGGDLAQTNGRAVQVAGLTQLRFTANANSHGVAQTAKANQARLERDGTDVTAQVVVNP